MTPPDPLTPAYGPVQQTATSRSATAADRRAGARRAALLDVIRASWEGLGVRALAEATGLHENTVRFHLDRLLEEGAVERRTGVSQGPGRPPLTFVARRDRDGAGHDNYELLARVLAGQLGEAGDPVARAEAAGRSWGRSLPDPQEGGPTTGPTGPVDPWDASLEELTRVLDDAGFAPEVSTGAPGAATVRVHHCPFLRLAREDRAVPCAVHLGLMEGVLEATGSAAAVERLEPFVTPSLCVARVRATAGR
ncbi:helix-turn-helix transcriptional regulator [Ornithinimicrobium pekingense]|uniref:Transcriptional regulator n=1 Tax=Ornithinimicrobium pekingense TaxID=384677 RepID=A0ABQ2F9R1_9MICO|nr:helix-turn-helix domain-containing protein [Ornithinimicrobium pekingense]GGK73174.1 transcriptional regulator [Ornithinimicrobium pekingense]